MPNEASLIHPEWVGDRQVWIDSDILNKIQFGDPTKGWPGDINLAVYWNPLGECFELLRWENGDYSLVARQKPGVVFDERIIEELVRRDQWRNPHDLHAEIEAHNEGLRQVHRDNLDTMIQEEVAPFLRRELMKDRL